MHHPAQKFFLESHLDHRKLHSIPQKLKRGVHLLARARLHCAKLTVQILMPLSKR